MMLLLQTILYKGCLLCVSLLNNMKASQEDIPENGIARQGMHVLSITRYCQITLQSGCTNLLSYPNVYTLSTTFSFSKLNVFFFTSLPAVNWCQSFNFHFPGN